MEKKYIQDLYLQGIHIGIQSMYDQSAIEAISKDITLEELLMILLGMRDGIGTIICPERRPQPMRTSLQKMWSKMCTKEFSEKVNQVYLNRSDIKKYLLNSYKPKNIGEYGFIEKLKDKRFMSKITLCQISYNLEISLVKLLVAGNLHRYLIYQAKYPCL